MNSIYLYQHLKLRWHFLCLIVLFIASGIGLQAAAQTADGDTTALTRLLTQSEEQLTKQNVDSAFLYYTRANQLASRMADQKWQVKTKRLHFMILKRKGQFKEALKVAEEVLALSKTINDTLELAKSFNNVGVSYLHLGYYEIAATYLLEGLKLAEQEKNMPLQRIFATNLASLYTNLKEKNKATTYAQKQYNLSVQLADTLAILNALISLGNATCIGKDFEKAGTYYEAALEQSIHSKRPAFTVLAYNNLGYTHNHSKKYGAAESYYLRALELLNTYPAPDYANLVSVYSGLAYTLYNLERHTEANHYFTKSVEAAKVFGAHEQFRYLYLLGAKIKQKIKEPALALDYIQQYELLNDSLNNIEATNNILRFDALYQTSQKEKALAEQKLALAEKNAQLQAKNKWLLASSALLIILGLTIFLFYLLYRNKQRANAQQLLALQKEHEIKLLMALMEGEEKERSRLARELHDGVGGILSATKMHMSILKNDESMPERSAKFDQTVSMLDNASQEIRTIAHNLSPDILLRYELHTALEIFCQKVSNQQLQVDFYFLGEPLRLKNNFKLIIYRMVQELVNNIIKHAEASHALVQLSLHEQVLSITVEDNGRGFNLTESKGIGLHNLKSRVQDIGGQLNIESSEGNGTTVYLEFDTNPFIEKQIFLSTAV